MANFIVVMTHSRPECLWLCLESLRRCRGIEKYPLYVAMNEDSDPEIPGVVKKLWQGLRYHLDIRPAGWLVERACDEAYKTGAFLSDDFFLPLGDDDLVAKDYLELVEYVARHLRGMRLLCVNTAGIAGGEGYPGADNGVLVKSQCFRAIAPMIFKEPFERYVKGYFCDEFYRMEKIGEGGTHDYNPAFINRCFPGQKFKAMGGDGIIKRVLKKHDLYSLTAVVPRSHTIGFSGVHIRGLKGKGVSAFRAQSLEFRVAFLQDAIKTGGIKEFFGAWADQYHNLEPDHKWKELRAVSEGGA